MAPRRCHSLKDKTAVSIARFIFSCMCKHDCFAIQINDQGTEFVNKVSAEMIERFNRTLKGKLRKLLATRAECWPEILEAVLFAYRCDKHQSTSERPCFQWLPLKSCQLGEETLADASIYLKNQDDEHFIVVTSLDKKKV